MAILLVVRRCGQRWQSARFGGNGAVAVVDTDNDSDWYWLKPDGQQQQGTIRELRALLAARTLPRSTFVWTEPWSEWRAAMQVPELADAAPPRLAPRLASAAPSADDAREPGKIAPATSAPRPERRPLQVRTGPSLESRASEPVTELTADDLETQSEESLPSLTDLAEPAPPSTDFEGHAPREAHALGRSDAPLEIAIERGSGSELAGSERRFNPAMAVAAALSVGVLLALSFGLVALSNQGVEAERRVEAKRSVRSVPGIAAARAEPRERVTMSCRITTPATRIAPSIERSVQPDVLAIADERVAIGFAASPREARGLIVDIDTLAARAAYSDSGAEPIVRVQPLSEFARFAVDRGVSGIENAAALETSPRSLVGTTRDALARRSGSEAAVELWKLTNPSVTVPRVARLDGAGFALTLRQGKSDGQIDVGWLDEHGAPVGELESLTTDEGLLGTPTLAARGADVLVAFAARENEQVPWRIKLVPITREHTPGRSVEVPAPTENLGAGAIAPALASLDTHHWLVQWTQGEPGKSQVRVQALTDELAPVGDAVVVSPTGANAGLGSVWPVGDRLLSLFIVPVPGRDELWGSVLRCQ